MTDADLIRFLDAQDQIYQQVVEELAKGRKETHWTWFIFPQLAGLGRSGMTRARNSLASWPAKAIVLRHLN